MRAKSREQATKTRGEGKWETKASDDRRKCQETKREK
jgi:hypothetical protein